MKLEGKTCLVLYNVASGKPPEEMAEADFESILNERSDTKAVRSSLKELGMNVRTLALRKLSSKFTAQLEEIKPDLIFNLCETLYNHKHKALAEMYVAGWLELLKIPYTGAPPLSLVLALNKMRCKQIARASGLPVAPSILAQVGDMPNLDAITPPFIVKPVREDGSFGITKDSVVKTPKEAEEQIKIIHEQYKQAALVEEFIEGREVTVPVFGNPPRVLGIGEIDFSVLSAKEPKIKSYEAKWKSDAPDLNAVFPAELETTLKNRIEKLALRAFQTLGCRDYARIDFRISENRRPYILEINPNPDFSPEGEFGDSARLHNLTYTDLVREIVENTLTRGNAVDFE